MWADLDGPEGETAIRLEGRGRRLENAIRCMRQVGDVVTFWFLLLLRGHTYIDAAMGLFTGAANVVWLCTV